MITIVLDGRYLVITGAILNLMGLFAVFMTDPDTWRMTYAIIYYTC